MLWKSEGKIREIVRDEIRRMFASEIDYRLKRTYNDKGELVGTDYTYREEEGHIVHFMTKNHGDTIEFFAAHSRSHANHEMVRQGGMDVESKDKEYNSAYLFNKRSSVPSGFCMAENGLIVPE